MSVDPLAAKRVREALPKDRAFVEKKMMGGLIFMANGHMCCGVSKSALMVRVGPERYAATLKEPWVRPLEFGGRRPRGFVLVDPEGYREPKALAAWVQTALDFVDTLPPKMRSKDR